MNKETDKAALAGARGSVIYVRCPEKKCGHVFDCDETFWWGADQNGDPTVENIRCPKCHASTKPYDRRRRQWSYDSFAVVDSPNAEVSDGRSLTQPKTPAAESGHSLH